MNIKIDFILFLVEKSFAGSILNNRCNNFFYSMKSKGSRSGKVRSSSLSSKKKKDDCGYYKKPRSLSLSDKKKKWKKPLGFIPAKDEFEGQEGALSFIRYVKNFTNIDIVDKDVVACFFHLYEKHNSIFIKVETPFENGKPKIYRYTIQLDKAKYIGFKKTISDNETLHPKTYKKVEPVDEKTAKYIKGVIKQNKGRGRSNSLFARIF